jgi:NAD(P)-dependent dehydrogenase (short-subunit alcohol dehydrogenase family)
VHLILVRIAGDYRKGSRMKIVVIGGSGLIGKKLVNKLRERGHEALAASPPSGVNTLSGVGLSKALEGAPLLSSM